MLGVCGTQRPLSSAPTQLANEVLVVPPGESRRFSPQRRAAGEAQLAAIWGEEHGRGSPSFRQVITGRGLPLSGPLKGPVYGIDLATSGGVSVGRITR